MSASPDYLAVSKTIDHALLKPNSTYADLEAHCALAARYQVATLCVLPYHVARAARLLAGSGVLATTVIGFPLGGHVTDTKVGEARTALSDGALEIDMVVNIGEVLSGRWDVVNEDIAAVLGVARDGGAKLKVIFENAYLDDSHKIRLCEICGGLEVDWVKTSTGFASSGATLGDVALMREHSPERVQVKASGGIKTLDQLLSLKGAGATRIGTSSTESILSELESRLSK